MLVGKHQNETIPSFVGGKTMDVNICALLAKQFSVVELVVLFSPETLFTE